MISIIAAIGKNNELGKNNKLIWHIKEDMKYFREKTLGHKVIMGSRTWDSLPEKLPQRENIVVTTREFEGPDLIAHGVDEIIEKYADSNEEVFVIGGGTLYMQFLPYAKNLYLTEVDNTDKKATTYFPEFDKSKYNREVLKKGSENGLDYAFVKYTKK